MTDKTDHLLRIFAGKNENHYYIPPAGTNASYRPLCGASDPPTEHKFDPKKPTCLKCRNVKNARILI